MKRQWIWVLIVAALVLIGYRLERHYNDLSKGFGTSALATNFPYDALWDIAPLTDQEREAITALLSQPYTYLGKGTQSYVLESEDHHYVIKFFKGKHLHFAEWLKSLFPIPLIGTLLKEDLQRREAKRRKIYGGCKLAYEEMREDSGVVFVHLNPSDDLPDQMLIIDARGRLATINPNDVPFYIQKKGLSFHATLNKLKRNNDLDGGRVLLAKLFSYLVDRSKRGIYDRDNNSMANLGCLDGQVATLDVGNLSKDPAVTVPSEYARRIVRHTLGIRRWLDIYWPELLPDYQALVNELEQGANA